MLGRLGRRNFFSLIAAALAVATLLFFNFPVFSKAEVAGKIDEGGLATTRALESMSVLSQAAEAADPNLKLIYWSKAALVALLALGVFELGGWVERKFHD